MTAVPKFELLIGLFFLLSAIIFLLYRRGLLPDFTTMIKNKYSQDIQHLYYEVGLPALQRSKKNTDKVKRLNTKAGKLKGAQKNDNQPL